VVPSPGPVRSRNRVLRVLGLGPGPRVVLDQRPIAASSNAMGTLSPLLEPREARYGALSFWEGRSVEAGMPSRDNAAALDQRGVASVLGLKGNQPERFPEAQRVLVPLARRQAPEAQTCARYRGRRITRPFGRSAALVPWPGGPPLQPVGLVRQTTEAASGHGDVEERSGVTPLPWRRAPAQRLFALVRQHWWRAHQGFWRLEVACEEEPPWSTRGWGPLGLGLGRCLACNVLHLLRDRRRRRPRLAQASLVACVEAVAAALVSQQGDEAGRRATRHGSGGEAGPRQSRCAVCRRRGAKPSADIKGRGWVTEGFIRDHRVRYGRR
jgi:hypothetical protein